MEKITVPLLTLLLISCNPGVKPEIEVYKTDSLGYVVKAGDYFKWSDVAADTTKMKEYARLYLLRQ